MLTSGFFIVIIAIIANPAKTARSPKLRFDNTVRVKIILTVPCQRVPLLTDYSHLGSSTDLADIPESNEISLLWNSGY